MKLKCIFALLTLSLSGCILAAAGVGGEAAYVLTQDDRTASETLIDQKITSSVKTKLIANQEVSGLDINVDTFKSVVTLKGVLDSDREASIAVDIARATKDVRDVKSKLVIMN